MSTEFGFGFRNDDHGNDPGSATPLVVDAMGNASSANNMGVITTSDDVDVFSYVSPGGNVEFRIDPEINYANLDVILTVRNSAGSTIATIDQGTVFICQTLTLPAGTYYLTVDGTIGDLGADSDYGSLGAYSISATATSNNCASLGYIVSEFWQNVPNEKISSIPLNTAPTFTSQLTSFETPSNITNGYGQRVRGYICAPVTGSYTFYIAADNIGELWLSTNESPASKRRIAHSPDWVGQREWTRYAEQKSVSINLQANTRYYIEALHVEGGGGDNLAVGWITPGSSTITVIPGSVLSPFSAGVLSTGTKLNQAYPDDLSVKVFPNPGLKEFTLLIQAAKIEAVNMKVLDAVGRIVESRSNLSTNSTVKFGAGYRPGIYFVEIICGGKRTTVKLIKLAN